MPDHYLAIKHIHMSAAFVSFALFFMRGLWMSFKPEMLQRRWVRIVPHVIDTILLAAALFLVVVWFQQRMPIMWIGAKVLGLVIYIILGTIALKRGPTRAIRIIAFLGALLTFVYILRVAFSKQPLPFA